MKKRRFIVYRWKNRRNGKCYIGITSNPENRRRHHIQGYSPESWIHQAIKKHGVNAFDYDELVSGLTETEALEKERELIAEYNSFGHGYNQTPGGYWLSGPKVGEKHHNAVLTEEKALQIIRDPCPETCAAEKYGTSRATIYHIRSGNTWSHLDRGNAPKYNNGKNKITDSDARAIFIDERKNAAIAREYGIDSSAVSHIKARRRWRSATKDLAFPT